MSTQYTVLRVWKQTAQKLKILAALRGESMIALLDRLVTAEYDLASLPVPQEED